MGTCLKTYVPISRRKFRLFRCQLNGSHLHDYLKAGRFEPLAQASLLAGSVLLLFVFTWLRQDRAAEYRPVFLCFTQPRFLV